MSISTQRTADDECQGGIDHETFTRTVRRLSKASVDKHFDAYADVPWDDPDMAIDASDPRFELPLVDPLAQSEWYRSQPAEVRSQIGLYRQAVMMKVGWQFENLLQQGLLKRALSQSDDSDEFRYLHHETIEESHHSLMFHEFVKRSGYSPRGMPPHLLRVARRIVIPWNQRFPSLFFLFVLGGEDPIDYMQRLTLKEGSLHPLVQRIVQIHITEEARHLSFARKRIQRDAHRLPTGSRVALTYLAPIVMGIMARLMLLPHTDMIKRFDIPRGVVSDAYRTPAGRALLRDSVAKTRRLWVEQGLVDSLSVRLWKRMGIWDPAELTPAARTAVSSA